MTLWEEIWSPATMIFQRPDTMAENGMPLEGGLSNMTRPEGKAHLGTSYHVDVTWVPADSVLMAEQAYTLSSGPTRTGLMVSCEQPASRRSATSYAPRYVARPGAPVFDLPWNTVMKLKYWLEAASM
jgi:hypothetical protein